MGFLNFLNLGNAIGAVGESITKTSEVFHANATKRDQLDAQKFQSAMAQYAQEYQHDKAGLFSRFVDGLNRLPRPLMALGTVGLFAYAMVNPQGFTLRMQGLAYVPEPLWWLLGAVVGFYFGAREMHHFRMNKFTIPPIIAPLPDFSKRDFVENLKPAHEEKNPKTLGNSQSKPLQKTSNPAILEYFQIAKNQG